MNGYCYAIINTKDGTINLSEDNILNRQLVFDTRHPVASQFIKYEIGKECEAEVVAKYEKKFGVKCKWETIKDEKGRSWQGWVIYLAK